MSAFACLLARLLTRQADVPVAAIVLALLSFSLFIFVDVTGADPSFHFPDVASVANLSEDLSTKIIPVATASCIPDDFQ